jgi:hypothetical protein
MESNKRVTAVEWLVEQLTEVDYNCINKTFLQSNKSLAGYKMRELFEQAKAMEKEQIIEAANILLYHGPGPGNTAAEQYYNETFK